MRCRSYAVPALVLLLCTAPLIAQSPTQDRFQRTFSLNSGGTLAIRNYKGLVKVEAKIEPADQSQVSADVVKRFLGSDDKLRDHWLSETKVTFDSSANRLEVRVDYPTHNCFFNCNGDEENGVVELVIRTPRNVKLDIDGYKPDMNISGITGDIRIHSYKAPIRIRDTAGAIDIDTYKSDIKLEDVSLTGALRIHDYKADAIVDARQLTQGADLSTSRGRFILRLPASTKATLDVRGDRHGMISSDFPVAATIGSGYERTISGDINGGGPQIRIRVGRGSASLQKSGSSI
jgi:hypothetical protein